MCQTQMVSVHTQQIKAASFIFTPLLLLVSKQEASVAPNTFRFTSFLSCDSDTSGVHYSTHVTDHVTHRLVTCPLAEPEGRPQWVSGHTPVQVSGLHKPRLI